MSIFAEFGGRSSYYTANEIDRLENPEKYDYDQAGYDAFAASAAKKADARQAALEASQDAIPYSYVGRGTGATNPAFSFAGYSGHTSGGTSGLSGFGGLAGLFGGGSTTETQGSSDGGDGTPPGGGGGGPRDGGPVQHRAEGGVITSPYADPMKPTMQAIPVARSGPIISGPMPAPDMGTGVVGPVAPSPGIGGAFESIQKQVGQQMGMMQASPLRVYQNYLMQTYAQPEMQAEQQKVDHFLDLVDQAERAHFGAEESFGYGGGPMAQQYMPQPQAQTPMDRGIASLPAAF